MKRKDIRLKTLKSVEEKFEKSQAWTCRGLSTDLNIHYHAVRSAIDYLLSQNKIIRLESSNRGELFIKNGI